MYTRAVKRHSHRKYYIIGGFATVIFVAIGTILLWPNTTSAPQAKSEPRQTVQKLQAKSKSAPSQINLQPAVDNWLSTQSGDYGIVVYDPANKAIVASHQPDKPYFTASIYKLYVAYLALMDIQSGVQNPDKVVLAGQTLKQCIYKMIHSSDSPCGETVLNNMGQAAVTKRLQNEFGFTNTSFPAFVTSAQDATQILERLQARQDLNDENTSFLLDAMKTQIYRNGIPAGMPEATVANKIGFNTPENWHDTGIVTLPNGREYVVSILGGGGVRSADIASFGQTIYEVLRKN